jgi:hypothetical protein
MLRFTLHRPSQNSAVCTCCHAMSFRDISGCVHRGVRLVPAGNAGEGHLPPPTAGCDVLAGVTGLRRVRRVDLLDPAGCFLFHPGHEQAPPSLEDAPVEAGLLCDAPTRLRCGSARGSGHGLDAEVLNPDHIDPRGRAGARLLNPVSSPVNLSGLQPGDQGFRSLAALRPATGTCEPALEPQEPLSFLRPQTLRAAHLTGGQCQRNHDSTIHPDNPASAVRSDRFMDRSERDVPTAAPIAGDAIRLPPGKCSATFELHPPDFGDQDAATCPVVLADPQRLGSLDPQALIPTCSAPSRAPVCPCEEVAPPLVEPAQRLLLDRLRPASKPPLRFPGGSQLCGLLVEPRSRPLPAPPYQTLFQAEIAHQPGRGALLQPQHPLRVTRIQPEPHGTQRDVGLRHRAGNQTRHPAAAEASSTTSTSTRYSSPNVGGACSTRKHSTGANKSWRRCARTSRLRWSSSTQPKTMPTCTCSTHPSWHSFTWSTPSQVSHPDGYGKTSSAESTNQQCTAESGHRHTRPDHAAAHRWPPSRTTSQARNNPTKKDFLPDLKDRVSAPDYR